MAASRLAHPTRLGFISAVLLNKIGNLETENAKLKKEVEILSKGFPGLLGLNCARKILDADCQCLFIRKIAIPEYLRNND